MQHVLSDDFPIAFYALKGDHSSPPSQLDGYVQVIGEWISEKPLSPFFVQPRLTLRFNGGHQNYLIEPSFLATFETAARTRDGRFMLTMDSEWIDQRECQRILQWLTTWVSTLDDPDASIVVSERVHVQRTMNTALVMLGDTPRTYVPPSVARTWAKDFARAADIATFLNLRTILKTKEVTA